MLAQKRKLLLLSAVKNNYNSINNVMNKVINKIIDNYINII